VVAVPDEELIAADASDQEVADLELVADGADELEFVLGAGHGLKVANHRAYCCFSGFRPAYHVGGDKFGHPYRRKLKKFTGVKSVKCDVRNGFKG
jgi:hypothetical protein